MTTYKDTDLFECGTKLYISWFQDKQSRQEEYSQLTNDTNLFTKNLKKETTVEQLIEAFKQF
jgi:hypothetical protein